MKKILTICSVFVALQGCSSIEQPIAQRALVEHDYVDPAAAVNSKMAEALSTALSGEALTIDGELIVFGRPFFSATGLTCRNSTESKGKDRVYCQRGPQNWFQANQVISEYQVTQELEAK